MATIRFSTNPQDRADQIVQAVGAAVVTRTIELTVDTDALIAAGIRGPQLRLQIATALQRLEDFIQNGSGANLPA